MWGCGVCRARRLGKRRGKGGGQHGKTRGLEFNKARKNITKTKSPKKTPQTKEEKKKKGEGDQGGEEGNWARLLGGKAGTPQWEKDFALEMLLTGPGRKCRLTHST